MGTAVRGGVMRIETGKVGEKVKDDAGSERERESCLAGGDV